MANKYAGNNKKLKQFNTQSGNSFRSKKQYSKSNREQVNKSRIYSANQVKKNSNAEKKEFESKFKNCVVAYSFVLFTSSILWFLQVPKELVFVLLVVPNLIILPYLIPLKTRQIRLTYIAFSLVAITILVSVLSIDPEKAVKMVKVLFSV
jgi:hypothetical protein